MTLAAGTRLGPFEILSPLGAGGMGEVYRAKDTKLGRDVAIKVLPAMLANDTERLARFRREAHLLASLNHSQIAAIYGLEDAGAAEALVLELVEGETLAERIARGPMSLEEAVPLARQIAEGLEYAHERGIVHRDLKPANVKITPEGKVKILDFGLAKALETGGSSPDVTSSPTLTGAATQAGVVIGTAAYMSPEQARGKAVDKRADIWAFGAVLYEMLTGRRAFEGETVSDTLAAILTRDPDWSALPAVVPPAAVALLRRCLKKDRRERQRDIGDAAISLDEAMAPAAEAPAPRAAAGSRRPPAAIGLLVGGLAFAAGLGVMRLLAARHPPSAAWSGTMLGGAEVSWSPRVSPDGRLVAFNAMVDGQTQVAVLQPGSGDWTVLTRDRTRGFVSSMCWSADGTRILYGRLDGVPRGVFSVPALGGEERLVLEDAYAPEALADGSLLVHRLNENRQVQVFRFWPDGGRLRAYPVFPQVNVWLSIRAFRDGKQAVWWGRSEQQPASDSNNYLYAIDLDSASIRRIASGTDLGTTSPVVAAAGADDRSIVVAAQRGDLSVIQQIPRGGGPPQVLTSMSQPIWWLDVGRNGELFVDQVERDWEAVTMDADGGQTEKLFTVAKPFYTTPLQLPDRRILFTVVLGGRSRLLAAAGREHPTPFVQTTEDSSGPLALVGASELAFLVGSGPARRLAIASLADGRIVRRLEKADGPSIQALAASPDGATLYYAAAGRIWAIPSRDGAPRPLCAGDSVAADPRGESLIVQLNAKDGVRLVRVPAGGGPSAPLSFPGVRLGDNPLSPAAVRADGTILTAGNASDAWPWYVAVLNPETGASRRITLPSSLDAHFPAWTPDGKILVFGAGSRSSIWSLRRASRASR